MPYRMTPSVRHRAIEVYYYYYYYYYREDLHNRDGSGGIRGFCSLSAGVPKWGLYGVAEQKGVWRTVLYNGFRFVLGNRDWPTLNTQWRRLS